MDISPNTILTEQMPKPKKTNKILFIIAIASVLVLIVTVIIGEYNFKNFENKIKYPSIPAPKKVSSAYPNASLYTGLIKTVGEKSFSITDGEKTTNFAWETRVSPADTLLFHAQPQNSYAPGSNMSSVEFKKLPPGSSVHVLANSKTMRAYQIIQYENFAK